MHEGVDPGVLSFSTSMSPTDFHVEFSSMILSSIFQEVVNVYYFQMIVSLCEEIRQCISITVVDANTFFWEPIQKGIFIVIVILIQFCC